MTAGTKPMQTNKNTSITEITNKESRTPTVPSIFEYFGNIKSEFKKIDWTSKEELIAYTKIVVLATFVIGIGIFFIDLIIQLVLTGLNEFVRLIVG